MIMMQNLIQYVTMEQKMYDHTQKHVGKICTLSEIDTESRERLSRINEELKNGFDLIKNFPKSVTVFGSARFTEANPYYQKAVSLSEKISKAGYTILTGGGPGIMEAANRGAHNAGGPSLGFTIQLPHEQVTNPYLTGHVDFKYFFSRKVCMTLAAEAYVYFPGGFGTFDEFFEILTLKQTKKIENVPIILVGSDFWQPLDELIKQDLIRHGTVDETDTNLYTITDDEATIVDIIQKSPIRRDCGDGN